MCSKSRKCSKQDKHSGKCNTERKFHSFWQTSRFQIRNRLKRDYRDAEEQLRSDYESKSGRFDDLEELENRAQVKEREAGELFQRNFLLESKSLVHCRL